jgi:hypothetical protein
MTIARPDTLIAAAPPRPDRTPRGRIQDPVALAVAAASAYLEIRAGRRPARQIERLLAPVVRAELARTVHLRRHEVPPIGGISVLRVISGQPGPNILDAAVVCRDGTAVTAVAVRVEFRRGGWSITALSTPEDQAAARRRGTS